MELKESQLWMGIVKSKWVIKNQNNVLLKYEVLNCNLKANWNLKLVITIY
jgi:hypothetical protein